MKSGINPFTYSELGAAFGRVFFKKVEKIFS